MNTHAKLKIQIVSVLHLEQKEIRKAQKYVTKKDLTVMMVNMDAVIEDLMLGTICKHAKKPIIILNLQANVM